MTIDVQYRYLFRKIGENTVSAYYVPVQGRPVPLNKILEMLARSISTLRHFQIGVQIQVKDKKFIEWRKPIYRVYGENQHIQQNKNEIALNENFEFLFAQSARSGKIIQKFLDARLPVR